MAHELYPAALRVYPVYDEDDVEQFLLVFILDGEPQEGVLCPTREVAQEVADKAVAQLDEWGQALGLPIVVVKVTDA